MPEPAPGPSADRNLLFGVLALQLDFVSRDALIAALHAWVLDKAKPLGQVLCEQGVLSAQRREVLETLLQEHLQKHGGNPEHSLAAVSTPTGLREDVRRLADPELDASLAHVSAPRPTDAGATVDHVCTDGTSGAGRYRVLRPYARGGLGEVFVAEDTELRREVALKEIRAERADDPISRGRFLLEAEVNGRLEHPGIVPVYGLGQHANGRPYYAMRLIQGETLKDAIQRFHEADKAGRAPGERSLALRQLLTRFVAVCNVIAYAHSRGVLHRDVKPANVMLGKYGETQVVDWGLAKVIGRQEGERNDAEVNLRPVAAEAAATQAGSALGTPAYMAPEQAAGRLDQLGPATDVYGLGATLYCLLTGQPPFQGDDQGELLQRVSRGQGLPPRQLKPEVPAALDALCRKAMALRPEERYASALDLAADVEHWLADEPVSAWSEPWSVRARRWLSRHRTLATAGVVGVVVAAISLAVTALVLNDANERERTQRFLAEANEKEAREQREVARQQRDEARQHLYAVNVPLADRAWEEGRIGEMRGLLEALRPRETDDKDLRGWEWHYLWGLCHAEQFVVQGGQQGGEVVVFRPDGKRIACAGAVRNGERVVVVLDADTGKESVTLHGYSESDRGLAYSPDGKRLAFAAAENTVQVCNADSGRALLVLKGHTGRVQSVGFSPDGKRLASTSEDKTLRVWDSASGNLLLTLEGHTEAVLGASFSPDGKRLASHGADNTLRIWDTVAGKQLLIFQYRGIDTVVFSPGGDRLAVASLDEGVKVLSIDSADKGPLGAKWRIVRINAWGVEELSFSPDSRRLAGAGLWDKVRVWDTETGKEVLTLGGRTGAFTNVAFSPDGKYLASEGEDKAVRLWDAHKGRELVVLKSQSGSVTGVAFTPDTKRLVSWGDATLRVGDLDCPGRRLLTLDGHAGGVRSVSSSRDGKRLASASGESVRVWDADGKQLFALHGHTAEVFSVAFSPDRRRLASGGWDKTVRIWDTDAGQPLLELRGHTGTVRSLAFSSDGQRLVSAGNDPIIQVWDAGTGRQLLSLKGHKGGVASVMLSPDGKRIASGGWDETVRLWDADSGQELWNLRAVGVRGVLFSPDCKKLASFQFASLAVVPDHVIRVLDVTDGKEVLALHGHTAPVKSIAFSPDGRRLVSAGSDKAVRVWNAETGKELLVLTGHTAPVISVSFSADGTRLSSAGEDGTIIVWSTASRAP
jgi:WD40 repeat protein/serine/threonine protein kinase